MKKLLLLLVFSSLAFAQVPTQWQVTIYVGYPNPPMGISYNIYRADGLCPASTVVVNWGKAVGSTTTLSYVDATVAPDHTYCYSAKAVVPSLGESAEGNRISVYVQPFQAPIINAVVTKAPAGGAAGTN